jgi:ubiquinone biosynthesis monooxygenase Coq7
MRRVRAARAAGALCAAAARTTPPAGRRADTAGVAAACRLLCTHTHGAPLYTPDELAGARVELQAHRQARLRRCAARPHATPRVIDNPPTQQAAPPAAVRWLVAELASDHAGETGAVYIYRGAAAALRLRGSFAASGAAGDAGGAAAASSFVAAHQATEEAHLALFDALLAGGLGRRSALVPAWRAAGFALGFVPTLAGGPPALYATVEAVEAFVVQHYAQQTGPLAAMTANAARPGCTGGACPTLVALLSRCAEHEEAHRADAAARRGGAPLTAAGRAWAAVVAGGSAGAVWLARRV